jgi:WD40 repeat protein
VVSVAFAPGGEWFATGHEGGAIRVYDARLKQLVAPCTAHAGRVNALAFLPDGTTLVSGSADHSAGLCEVTTGRRQATLDHPKEVTAVAVSSAADERLILTAGFKLPAQLWVRKLGKPVAPPFVHVGDTAYSWVRFSPDGRTVATAGSDSKRVCLWRMPTPYPGEAGGAVQAMEVLTGFKSDAVGASPLAAALRRRAHRRDR